MKTKAKVDFMIIERDRDKIVVKTYCADRNSILSCGQTMAQELAPWSKKEYFGYSRPTDEVWEFNKDGTRKLIMKDGIYMVPWCEPEIMAFIAEIPLEMALF